MNLDDLKDLISQFCDDECEYLYEYGVDCSETSKSLSDFLNERKIRSSLLRIESRESVDRGRCYAVADLTVPYRDMTEDFCYHYVTLILDKFIIDVEWLRFFITIDEYKEKLKELNPNLEIVYTEE